ncbi:MAG: hypothetical protein AB7F75_08095 [Planctomycetota bacterium]
MGPRKAERGQILVVELAGILLAAVLFIEASHLADGLALRQREQLAADLAALSAARVRAETLEAVALVNRTMLMQTQVLVAVLSAPLVLAASVVGLPLVPAATAFAKKTAPRIIKGLKRLSSFESLLAKGAPSLAAAAAQWAARNNGLSLALTHPHKPLALQKDPQRFLSDVVASFTDNPLLRRLPSPVRMATRTIETKRKVEDKVDSLEDLVNRASVKIPESAGAQGAKALEEHRSLLGRLGLNTMIPSPLYLTKLPGEDRVDVACRTSSGAWRLASARIRHPALADTASLSSTHNLYEDGAVAAEPHNGFQVELCAVPGPEEFPMVASMVSQLGKALEGAMPAGKTTASRRSRWWPIHH